MKFLILLVVLLYGCATAQYLPLENDEGETEIFLPVIFKVHY